MMRQSEFKMRLEPELGRYTRQHIYGEGMMDVFKSVGKKIFGKTMKKAAKRGAKKAMTAAATKTGEHVGKKAGDKIVQMLSKEKAKPTKAKNTALLELAMTCRSRTIEKEVSCFNFILL